MKKHLFGFAIFGFIFASFAVAFAYFYAPPIPRIAEIKEPVYQSEPQTTCRKKAMTARNIKYEVVSSQYFYGENKVVSKIKLTWNGYGAAPRKINVFAMFAASGDSQKTSNGTSQFFESPFSDSDSGIVTVVSDFWDTSEESSNLSSDVRFDKKKNLYAFFTIFDENSKPDNPNTFISTNPTPVVFVHDGKFIGRGTGSGIGTFGN